MDLAKVSKLVRDIPWEKIGTSLPVPEDKKELESIKSELTETLALLETNKLDPEISRHLEKIAARFKALGSALADKTKASELYSKARLNEILTWNVGHYAERALFLAGRASVDRNIVEPYKTQILNQAVHACLLRYRQAANLREKIVNRLDGSLTEDIDFLLKQLVGSLLGQLQHFSEVAYESDKEHALSTYHYVVSNLVAAYEKRLAGHTQEAKSLAHMAQRAALAIPEPRPGIHYMQKSYHVTNYKEFKSFERMSKEYSAILDRFEYLHAKAQSLDDASVLVPREYFNLAWMINTETRTASVMSILIALFSMSTLDYTHLHAPLSELWTNVAGMLAPGDSHLLTELRNSGSLAALNTGGLASIVSNTGGLADKLSLFA